MTPSNGLRRGGGEATEQFKKKRATLRRTPGPATMPVGIAGPFGAPAQPAPVNPMMPPQKVM